MIEWQNESSLFTIRVQGKQWYWVYKYDPSTTQNIITIPKNIGHDKWRITTGLDSYGVDTYYQAINLAAQIEFQDSYVNFLKKNENIKNVLNSNTLANEVSVNKTKWDKSRNTNKILINNFNNIKINKHYMNNKYDTIDLSNLLNDNLVETYSKVISSNTYIINKLNNGLYRESIVFNDINNHSYETMYSNLNSNYNTYYDYLQLDETTDIDSNIRQSQTTQPVRVIKGILNQHNIDMLSNYQKNNIYMNKLIFLNIKINNSGELLKDKDLFSENLWGFRQKKYKRIKKFAFKPELTYNPNTFKVLGVKSQKLNNKVDIAGIDLLSSNNGVSNIDNNNAVLKKKELNISDNTNYRTAVRINRHRSELVPVTLARRLLRTKRTLVLPAHINLTVITNSYDVVHSWFIPGLGLKLDCVPGRSTHHTFYIDNIGFYYGQCAEICGRYHHHMPIRLCALPFEQFVVWWQSKGMPRLNRLCEIQKNKITDMNLENTLTEHKLIYRSY